MDFDAKGLLEKNSFASVARATHYNAKLLIVALP